MPGGRPRKPIERHKLDGTYRKDRHGEEPAEEPGSPPPRKPKGLDPVASEMWETLVGMLGAVVRDRDAAALEQMCRWWSRGKDVDEELDRRRPGSKGYNALLIAAGICMDKFDKLACRFGLTPADRSKLRAEAAAVVKAKVMTRPKSKNDRSGPPKKGKK